ncbi:MAG: MFS transporter [Dehalococcoidia bacterium]|nr:MFS transporter [Dehalococcoidia bacterium]
MNLENPNTPDPSSDLPGKTDLSEATEIARGGRRAVFKNTFASMAYRDFVWLWAGQVTHAFALWVDQIAKPLLILSLTGSPIHLGMILVARTVPAVGFGLIAGVVADNFNRRAVLLITKVIVLGLTVVFTALVVTGLMELWHIYAYNVLRGATMAFDQPARRAMIPSIVPSHLVTNAMALSTGSMTATRIAGAAGAGLLISIFDFGGAYVVTAVMYVGAVFFTWMLRPPDHKRSGYRGVRSMGNDLVEGIKYSWNAPDIRGVLIISLGWFTFGMAFMQVFAPLFAIQILDIGYTGFGYMVSVSAVGGLAGALLLAGTNPSKGRGLIMLGLLAIFGFLLIIFSASTYLLSVPLAFAMMLLLGMGQSSFFPLINAVLVEKADEHMRGRVLGVLSLDRATTTLGGAMAGFMAAALGAQVAQILFGVGLIATAAVMFLAYPPLRRID